IPFIFVLTDDVPEGAVTIDNIINVTCPGAANGGIEFSIVFDPAFVAPADTLISDGFGTYENGSLPAGNYCLEIIDGDGCIAGGECFTIEAPDPVLLDFILVDECDGAPGSIELLVSGGTGMYQFDWSDLAGSNDPQHRGGLSAGTYTVAVTDANGCIATNTVVISVCPNSCETATIVGTTATMATCGNADGSAIITLMGNPNDYNFTWSPDVGTQGVGANTRTNLSFGGYSVTIANVSDPACFIVTEILIANSDGPQATFTKTPATCQASDGSATLTPATFNYTWFDAATDVTRSDLASGVYFVTVVDPANASCPNVIEILIEEDNPLEATAAINAQPDCNENNGSVTINVTGGTNYTFLWEDNVTTQTRTDLGAGIHRVTVSDSDPTTMCELPFIFILTDNVPVATVTIDSVIHVSCPGETNGAIEYTVDFDPAFAAPADTLISNSFTLFENRSLGAGVYCIELRDNNNCVAGGACFEIEEPDPIDVQIALTPDCNAGGTVDLIIAGGTAPYSVDWSDINGINDPVNRMDLPAGTYDFTVLDANDCSYANQTSIEVCPCTTPTLNSVVMVESTCGNEDGMITINLVEDVSAYEYTWSPDIGTSIGDGNTRVNLPFGGYTVSVSEPGITNCTLEVPVVVVNSDGPTATVVTTPATCQAADGTATLLPATLTYLWEDNIESDTRVDLPAGSYFVTVTDPNTPDCANAILVEVLSENPLVATADITTKPDCNTSNGIATLNVSNGSGNYTYLWADGITTQSRSDLAAGIHMVTITDNDASMCALPFLFVVTDNVAEGTVVLDSVININCFGAANGGIEFTINFDPTFVAPADTVITDGITNFINGALPTGDYCMIITDANDCVGGGICFTIEAPEALDLHFAVQPACDTLGTIDVTVNGGTSAFNFDWEDIVGTTDEEDRDSLATGDFSLTVTDANGCVISESSITVPVCPDHECDFFNAQDSLTLETQDCSGLTNLCLNLPLDDLLNFNITVNGAPYMGIFPGCSFDTTGSYQYIDLVNSVGPFEVNGWTVDGNMFSSGTFITPSDLVDSMNIWDPMGEWSISAVGSFITGGASGSLYGTLFVRDLTTQAIFEFQYNSALLATNYGLELPLGDNEVIITNTTGCSDTLMTSVVCVNPDTIYITILEEEMDTVCFNDLELMGEIDTLYNYCALDNVEIEILEDTSCVVFTGVLVGFDTACIVACDTFGICDTTFVIIEVIPDTSLIMTDVVCDTIFINSEVVYCPDTTELQGNIVFFENICEEESDGEVDFYLSQDSLCVFYTGQALGQDSACIVMCDDLGECDTTYFCISVIEYLLPPIANDDYDTTLIGEPVVINVKANDVTLGGLDTFYIVNEPLYGTLGIPGSANGFNPDCTITYNASDEYCEREDYFTYAICNANGCDTATVYVWLECADIVIFTAVSPNRDGVNDVFFISGIEDFPNSELEIYNRWGNRVYQKVGYKNDWRGTWDGNKDLPDGTYYYLLQLNDPQDTRVFSGYLELYR
ncbi:MAG: gliding motility-associated C-terminal domain-containing protein, partial [Saprospiraceae bacterium]